MKKIYQQINSAIRSSKNILLHLHPSPDPDSIGSALAMYFYLTSIGKKVTLIKGDSELREKSQFFPGFEHITDKNIFEIDIKKFDLFIILDSSNFGQVSRLGEIDKLLTQIKTIYIDHHPTNLSTGQINLIQPRSSSTCEMLFDLFKSFKVKLTPDISTCLYLGILSDTGSFTNINTTYQAIYKSSVLAKNIKNLPSLMFEYRNNSHKEEIDFIKLALQKYKVYFNNQIAISAISLSDLSKAGLSADSTKKTFISEMLRQCKDWKITICMVETEKNKNEISMRSRTEENDVSLIATQFNGGGHKVAAGAVIYDTPSKALTLLLAAIQQTNPELGEP